MPLHVEQFRYGRDNLGYLVFGRSEAMAVDGGPGTKSWNLRTPGD